MTATKPNVFMRILSVILAIAMCLGMPSFSVFADTKTPQQQLEDLLDEIYALNAEDYTKESYDELIEQANTVNRPVTPYDEETEDGMPDFVANIMITNLTNLKNALVKVTPQSKLEALLDEIYALNPEDYTADSWNELKEQADAVNRPVKPYDEETEEGMPDFVANIMITNLTNLKNALVKVTPQSKLEALLDKIYALNPNDYTADSWNELKEQADTVNRPVTPYDEVTGDGMPDWVAELMYKNLTALIDALVPASDTRTVFEKLEEKLKEAVALNKDNYTAESWSAVQEIIDSVDRPVSSDNLTEKLATKLLSDLEKAIAGLQEKPDDTFTLDDGVYAINIKVSGTFGSYVKNKAKVVAKDGKYTVTLYTSSSESWDYEGGYKSNKQYKVSDKSDWTYPVIEFVKPEYNNTIETGFEKYAVKNLISGFDLTNTSYTDEVKAKFSADNDYMFFDTVYGDMADANRTITFTTDTIDTSFFANGLYSWNRHNYDGSITVRQYPFYGKLEIDKDEIVKLPDNINDLSGVYVYDKSSKILFRNNSVTLTAKNNKVYATYNIDTAAYVSSNDRLQSTHVLDDNNNEIDTSDGTVTVVYNNYDELIAGIDIKTYSSAIDTLRGATVYHHSYTLTPDLKAKPVVLTDESTGIKLYSSTRYISENAKLNVKLVKDTGSSDTKNDPWANAMTHLPKYNKEYYFSLNVTDDGKLVTDFGGNIPITVPAVEGLNKNSIRLFLNKWDKFYSDFAYGWFNENIVAKDGYYSILLDKEYYDGNWCIYDEKMSDSDGSSLSDGTYRVPITTFNLAQPGQTSMSAQCLGEYATLVVKNGVKRLELEFKSVNIGELDGYLIQMWEQEKDGQYKELTYTSYYKNEDGSYFTDALNEGTNNYYPKTGYMILPTDDAQFLTNFRVSAMDAIMGDSGDATREAIFTIYYDEAEKISDETPDPDPEEIPGFEPADMSKLKELIEKAEALSEDDYTLSTFTTMKNAVASAKVILNNIRSTQEEVDAAAKAIEDAVNGLEKKAPNINDKNNLPDGKYTLYAQMIKTDRESFSMSNNAINHNVWLEVKDGEYYLTMQFKGMSIYNKFGYLLDLAYFDKGYTYNEYGIPKGNLVPATVLTTQKDSDGNDVIDQYNDANTLYPELLKIKLVDKASEKYVPLQVFVPVMESIAEETGTQPVLMQLDWSTLKVDESGEIDPEKPVEQSPEVNFTDTATGVKVHADKGVLPEGASITVTAVTSGAAYDSAVAVLGDDAKNAKLYEVKFFDKDGNAVKPNGTVSITFPSDDENTIVYRISDDSKVLVKGTFADHAYTVITKTGGIYAEVLTTAVDPEDPAKPGDSDKPATPGDSDGPLNPGTGVTVGFAAVVPALCAGAAMIAAKKRRNKKGE